MNYLGIEFKRASAAKNSLWAIGGDHQLYVMVFGVEVPIRNKEVNKVKLGIQTSNLVMNIEYTTRKEYISNETY